MAKYDGKGQAGLEGLSAFNPSERRSRRRCGAMRGGAGEVLGVSRRPVRESGSAEHGRSQQACSRRSGSICRPFDGCVRAGKHHDQIAAVLSEARNHPIEVTPTFLINGRMVHGCRPSVRAFGDYRSGTRQLTMASGASQRGITSMEDFMRTLVIGVGWLALASVLHAQSDWSAVQQLAPGSSPGSSRGRQSPRDRYRPARDRR